jgi:hypothetical protein
MFRKHFFLENLRMGEVGRTLMGYCISTGVVVSVGELLHNLLLNELKLASIQLTECCMYSVQGIPTSPHFSLAFYPL